MTADGGIGIFDSGVGGLTVLHALLEALPGEHLIYLGDTGRHPYGTKSAETVTRYSIENVEFLIAKGVKLLVVACNTASAVALDTLILACTHYPLLRPVIADVMGEGVTLVDSAEETARAVSALLAARGLARGGRDGSTSFFVTDVPDRFVRIGQRFLGARVDSAVRLER